MRLLLVLAAIYDSTGSSDVGRRAKGEHAVSSQTIQRLATLKAFFLRFIATRLRLGASPPRVRCGGNEVPAPQLQMIQGVGVLFFCGGGGTSCLAI